MKKTLAALAVLGAFAGSAAAADVTLYGVVDLGLNYQYSKVGDADAVTQGFHLTRLYFYLNFKVLSTTRSALPLRQMYL